MKDLIIEFLLKLGIAVLNKKRSNAYQKVAEIYDNMLRVVSTTAVERFLLLRVENGGGVVKPGCDIYTTIVYEVFKNPVVSIKEKYKKRHADHSFMRFISDVMISKKVVIIVDEMPEGTLKDIYKSEGLEYVELDYIYHDKKAFFFTSIGTTQKHECFSDATSKTEINNALNNIQTNFKS